MFNFVLKSKSLLFLLDDVDVFQCGKCKIQFTSLPHFMQHKQTCGTRVSVQQQQQQPQPMTHQHTQQQPPHQQQHVQHNTYQQQQVCVLKGVLKVRRKYWSV